MRRLLPVLLGCVLIAVPGFAQRGGRGGGGGMRGGGGVRGFSGGGFRGGGFRGGGFRGGRNFSGFRGYGNRFGGFYYYNPFYYSGLYYPYLWDLGWDFDDFGEEYPESPQYPAYSYPTYSSPSPSVLIISNQAPPPPPRPVIVEAPPASTSAETTQAQKYEEPLYLLAMNDGIIRAVLAYWVDGKTVHYVNMDHQEKQVPLSSLDRSLSERLNRERNVTFSLPG